MGFFEKMAGVWSRLASGLQARMAPLRRGIKTGQPKKGGGKHPDGWEGDNIGVVRPDFSRWNDRQVLNAAMLWTSLVVCPSAPSLFTPTSSSGQQKFNQSPRDTSQKTTNILIIR